MVISRPKDLSPTSVSQYRPISILPVISKVLEKVVSEQLANYVESEELLPDAQ